MSTKMIGLDLGQREVRAWQMEVSFSKRESRSILRRSIEQLEDEELLDAQLRTAFELLDREGLERESYALAMPRTLTSVLRHSLPAGQIKLIDEVLPGELEDLLPFDYDDLFYDYQITHLTESTIELLIVYTLREDFEDFMMRCESVGLDPRVLTLGGIYAHDWLKDYLDNSSVITQTLEHSLESPDLTEHSAITPLRVFLDVGEQGSEWVIYQGDRLCHIQRADVGGGSLTQALAQTFKVDYNSAEEGKLSEARWIRPEALRLIEEPQSNRLASTLNGVIVDTLQPLKRELARSLMYCEQKFDASVDEIYLMGGGSRLRGLDQLLADDLMLKVSRLPISQEMSQVLEHDRIDGAQDYLAFVMARGLAKRLYNRSINLRRGPYSYAGDSGLFRGLTIAICLTLLAIVGLQGGRLYMEQTAALDELAQLNREVDQLGQSLFDREGLELETIQLKVDSAKETKVLIPEVSAFATLGELSRHIGQDINIEVDSIDINLKPGGRGSIRFKGKTESIGDVSSIMSAVKKTTCFAERAKQDKVRKSTDGRRIFTITSSSSCK
jgi:Tfp pilus assembly PilM family ATPase